MIVSINMPISYIEKGVLYELDGIMSTVKHMKELKSIRRWFRYKGCEYLDGVNADVSLDHFSSDARWCVEIMWKLFLKADTKERESMIDYVDSF